MTAVYNPRVNDVSEPIPFRLEMPDSTLNGLVDLPAAPGERPAVVICQGSTVFPEWAFLPYLAALLAARGFVAIRTDSHPLVDLLAVLDAIGETIVPGRIDRRRLGLFGHGQGGGHAILAASQSPWSSRVRALVTWAAIVDAEILSAAASVRVPWLIVHGAEDETVPAEEGRRLAGLVRSSGGGWELREIPGASHTFGARHPFTGPTPQLIQAFNATQRWLRAHL
ncbi:MAG TPA: dienelactone hydrolase family protein [Thermoanaerobaculia bacterium]|jgi:dienelactone hydrolase|nr:dienelactone hydrolase family protein [Thermoanaerobaculia bacterium]